VRAATFAEWAARRAPNPDHVDFTRRLSQMACAAQPLVVLLMATVTRS